MDPIDTAFDPGKKIVFSDPDAGYDHHKATAAKHLIPGAVYTLIRQRMGSWHTDYWLAEVPGVAFNSVQFSDAADTAAGETEAAAFRGEEAPSGWGGSGPLVLNEADIDALLGFPDEGPNPAPEKPKNPPSPPKAPGRPGRSDTDLWI